MQIRHAIVSDAPAMGEVMVEAFLAAHKDQYPPAAWQKRVDEWTPAVSAAAWARELREIAATTAAGGVPDCCVYIALDEHAAITGIIYGALITDITTTPSTDTVIAEISALYVKPGAQGNGIGRALVHAAATHLAAIGATTLHIAVLVANRAARGFYEAIGGQLVAERLYEEDGFQLPEVVYGWEDIRIFNRRSES